MRRAVLMRAGSRAEAVGVQRRPWVIYSCQEHCASGSLPGCTASGLHSWKSEYKDLSHTKEELEPRTQVPILQSLTLMVLFGWGRSHGGEEKTHLLIQQKLSYQAFREYLRGHSEQLRGGFGGEE